jgi:carboxypeptidase Q
MIFRLSALARVVAVALMTASLVARQEPVDRATIEKIRQEGTDRSKVLTGSRAHKSAAEWSRQQFDAAGLKGAHLEPWEFGRGWELTGFTVEMTAPAAMRDAKIARPQPGGSR